MFNSYFYLRVLNGIKFAVESIIYNNCKQTKAILLKISKQQKSELVKKRLWIVPVCSHQHWLCLVSSITKTKTLMINQQVFNVTQHEIFSMNSIDSQHSACELMR